MTTANVRFLFSILSDCVRHWRRRRLTLHTTQHTRTKQSKNFSISHRALMHTMRSQMSYIYLFCFFGFEKLLKFNQNKTKSVTRHRSAPEVPIHPLLKQESSMCASSIYKLIDSKGFTYTLHTHPLRPFTTTKMYSAEWEWRKDKNKAEIGNSTQENFITEIFLNWECIVCARHAAGWSRQVYVFIHETA